MAKLYQELIVRIKTYITEQQLLEGSKLPTEEELRELFGVSRNALREALKALQFMNVLDSTPGVGYTVRSFNYDSLLENLMYYLADDASSLLRETRTVRKALECFFFNQAFDSLTNEDINELGKISDEIKMSINIRNINRLKKADKRFHKTLFKHINNKLFQSLLSTAWHAESALSEITHLVIETAMDHKKIYHAIQKGDREKAYSILSNHFWKGI